jgi:Rrf2 family protein
MKLSAQEEYGLRCILSLARNEMGQGTPGSPLTINDIARREGLSPQYAGKLIRILGRAGLVESARGCKGGYRLARPAASISVAEALAALGGRIYEPGTCDRFPGDRRFCVHTNDCSIRSLWAGLQAMVDRILTRTTLSDLVGPEGHMAQALEGLQADAEPIWGWEASAGPLGPLAPPPADPAAGPFTSR